ncbi:hypothetical protein CSV77_15470 [Sporosarcina sp. P16b]|uniref:geobacillin-26 family protein n=1 Tax=Sporosarcina sp. P16b TaxID=2048261 RepID=UPI000C163228|nr:geobacillin-26 family protein [Sporosarcina sp. P16b]PIC69088.1 hypothetical protein CSV77_15470 [Sporosarcina sp. P16b]
MRKLIILFLSLMVAFSMVLPSTGKAESVRATDGLKRIQNLEMNQDYVINEILDDANTRIVEVIDKNEDKTYRTTFNKQDSSFETVEINNKIRGSEKEIFNSKQSMLSEQKSEVAPAAIQLVDSGSNLSNKFKYYAYTQKIWVIQSEGKSKNPTETTKNSSDILSFRSAVNNLRGAELKTRAALGTAATATVIAAITAPTAWGPILSMLTAIGAGATAIAQAYDSYNYAKDCRLCFGRVTIR